MRAPRMKSSLTRVALRLNVNQSNSLPCIVRSPARRVNPLLWRGLFAWGVAALWLGASGSAWAKTQDVVEASGALDGDNPRVIARLVSDRQQVVQGGKLKVGVELVIDEGWYVYWRNSGDSGMSTSVSWRISADDEASTKLDAAIDWPAPTVHPAAGDILNYGYADRVVHASVLDVPDVVFESVRVFADVDYLACRKICVIGKTTLSKTFEAVTDQNPVVDTKPFEGRGVPLAPHERGWTAKAVSEPIKAGSTPQAMLTFECGMPSCKGQVLDVADPEDPKHAYIPDVGQRVKWRSQSVRQQGDKVIVELQGQAKAQIESGKELIDGVLKLRTPTGERVPIRVQRDVVVESPQEEASATGSDIEQQSASQAPAPKKEKIGVLYAIVLAFFGGMLLNAMPCVFPVLTLKLTALVEMSHRSRRGMMAQSMAYTAGITASMLTLAGVLIGLKFAGTQVGWGFQFQNPWYLVAQSVLMVLFAVNLFGGFEVILPVNLHVGNMNLKDDGLARSFFEGLLCVLLATPCTAPMMGSAVGFALSANALVILTIFTALSLGLASPFILLALFPGWQKWMPKPGPWLGHMKTLMGFTCLGAGAWMVWLVGTSYGPDAMFKLLLILVALSMVSWVYGLVQFGPRFKSRMVLVVGILLGSALVVGAQDFSEAARAGTTAGAPLSKEWEPFDEQAIKDHLADGRPVFLDFTAAWCASCKVNEKTILNTDAVRSAAAQHNVVMMKADWTRPDDRIRDLLAKHGRSGIPMYLVYSPHRPNAPELLPEIITRDRVRKALADAAQKK